MTFQTIAPRSTTAPSAANKVTRRSETSPALSPRRRRETLSEYEDGTTLIGRGTLNRDFDPQTGRHQPVTTTSPCVCPPGLRAQTCSTRLTPKRDKGRNTILR